MMFLILYFFLFFIISIDTCPLKTVDIHSGCYCGIEIDGTNYIQCHPYSIDHIPKFTRSYIHEKLNLSKNFIENLTNQSFQQLKVKRIYLEENPIQFIDQQTFNINLLHYLEELYIDTINNHNIEFLCYGTWKKLRILQLSGFNFNQYQYCFDKFQRLEKLIIKNSHINHITHHITKLPFLYELSLVNNQIEYFNFDKQYLSSIRILNLTSNYLRLIPDDLNIRLPHLITLDLSYNLFENLPLINQITTLNINLSFNLIEYFQLNNNQHILDLSSNPICTMEKTQIIKDISNLIMNNLTNLHCDCRLAFFLKINSTNQLKLFDNQTICASPSIHQGLFLKDLTYEQLMHTCSIDLPRNCKEITNFKEIQQGLSIENTTQIVETAEKLNNDQNQLSSFRLTSFSTHYENNDLLIYWDFDASLSLLHLLTIKFQIIIEEEISSKTEIIRQSDFLSPYLKQYLIPNLPENKNYYVCLLLIRSSLGIDKYCREIRTKNHQTFLQILFLNRSIILGFLVGIILTISLLIILAFICHLHYKRKHSSLSLFNHQEKPKQCYMYVTQNELDGTYSHSIHSSLSSKYHHLRKTYRRTYLTPIPPWYNRNLKQSSLNSRSPCCFLQYHDRTLSSSTTTNRITSLSSEYSHGIDKEQMTSTSIMSNTSLDEQQSQCIQSPAKHVYEELGDTNLFL